MAGRGPAPKPAAERVRRNADVVPEVTVAADGALHGPELPSSVRFVLGSGDNAETVRSWPAETVAWWETWRRSPQAQTFTATDWSFLLDTARLHALFWLGDSSRAQELRLRAAKFGATPEDRLRLRLSIASPAAAAPPVPASDALAARREGRRARLEAVAGE